jgi:hypothetical protein
MSVRHDTTWYFKIIEDTTRYRHRLILINKYILIKIKSM